MKLKVQHLMDSMLVVTNIINRQAPMPQRGKYLLARMHQKLLPEYTIIDARRDAMIKEYDTPDDVRPGEFKVPDDKMPEFIAAWKVVADEEIEVDVQPMPLTALCMPNATEGLIEASEFITLGDLVVDNFN